MKIKDLFEKWNLTEIQVKLPILKMEWKPCDTDKDAAWDLYAKVAPALSSFGLPSLSLSSCAAIHSKMASQEPRRLLDPPEQCAVFRSELQVLQMQLRNYTGLLADLANVEDLTGVEEEL